MSVSFSVDDFPCPLRSIATTLAFSLITRAEIANESLTNSYKIEIITIVVLSN